MTRSSSRNCPVCDSVRRRLFFHQDFATIENGTPFTGYDVVVCQDCGAAYADGIPDQSALDRYYREMSKYENAHRQGAESDYDRRRLALIAGVIAPHVRSANARILDIGCSNGRLLANLRERGFSQLSGIDPSPACSIAAAELYSINVRTLTLSELATIGERFDFVIMVGVLEHLRDVDGALQIVRALLSNGGGIYLEVPDVTAFADWPNAPYQDFSTEHVNFFSPTSLDNLMNTRGFVRSFVEQNHREQSYKTVMSNISAVYRKGGSATVNEVVFDQASAIGLERYLAASAALDQQIRATIDTIVDQRRPIIVWGVGTHTTRLMATSRLAQARIVAFVESNTRYHGKRLHGLPIIPPEALKGRHEAVLISSRVFEKEIVDQIRQELHCANELIRLYNV